MKNSCIKISLHEAETCGTIFKDTFCITSGTKDSVKLKKKCKFISEFRNVLSKFLC